MNYRWARILGFLSLAICAAPCEASETLFHSYGCGSPCRVDLYILKPIRTDSEGLTKALLLQVSTSGAGVPASPTRIDKKRVWVIADCNRSKLNPWSSSSNGRGSHADASAWIDIDLASETGTNFDGGMKQLYLKMCRA